MALVDPNIKKEGKATMLTDVGTGGGVTLPKPVDAGLPPVQPDIQKTDITKLAPIPVRGQVTDVGTGGLTPEQIEKQRQEQQELDSYNIAKQNLEIALQESAQAADKTAPRTTGIPSTEGIQQGAIPQAPPTELSKEFKRVYSELSAGLQGILDQGNKYFTDLETMKFDYNPYADEAFKRDAREYESLISRQMAARGMLYSGITQNAIQSKIASLAIDYTNMNFQRFESERNFTLQMAQLEQSRLDKLYTHIKDMKSEAWNMEMFRVESLQADWANKMKAIEFNWNMQVKQLELENAQADRKLQIAQLAYNLESEKIMSEQKEKAAALDNGLAEFKYAYNELPRVLEEWEKNNYATSNVVLFFKQALGVSLNTGVRYYSEQGKSKIKDAGNAISIMEMNIRSIAHDVNDSMRAFDFIDSIMYPEPEKIKVEYKDEITTYQTDEEGNIITDKFGDPIPLGKKTKTTSKYEIK